MRLPQYLSLPETACSDEGILPDSFDASKPAGSPDARSGAEEELRKTYAQVIAFQFLRSFSPSAVKNISPYQSACGLIRAQRPCPRGR